jgi:hypothetical protein
MDFIRCICGAVEIEPGENLYECEVVHQLPAPKYHPGARCIPIVEVADYRELSVLCEVIREARAEIESWDVNEAMEVVANEAAVLTILSEANDTVRWERTQPPDREAGKTVDASIINSSGRQTDDLGPVYG